MSWNEVLGWSFSLVGVFKTVEETYELLSWVLSSGSQTVVTLAVLGLLQMGVRLMNNFFINEVNWPNDFG